MASLTVQDAARALGISPDTIRRRIRNGGLPAQRQPTPQGYQWLVEVSQDLLDRSGSLDPREAELRHLEQTVQELRESLAQARDELRARRTEVSQLLRLVETLQTRNAPGPGTDPTRDN
jgi:excisionase family DNA binding protein